MHLEKEKEFIAFKENTLLLNIINKKRKIVESIQRYEIKKAKNIPSAP